MGLEDPTAFRPRGPQLIGPLSGTWKSAALESWETKERWGDSSPSPLLTPYSLNNKGRTP